MHRARWIVVAAAGLVVGAGLEGCVSGTGGRVHTVPAATDQERAALLDRVKSLSGEWEFEEQPGPVATVYAVSSNGSVVREIMFPGQPHEMTNVYHMDGRELVMTHYCAAGNQPRMRARAGGPADQIRFETDGVSNLHAADEHYMGEMTLVFLDDGRVRQEWRSFDGGKMREGTKVFTLRRKS